jgi:hypothetical protein
MRKHPFLLLLAVAMPALADRMPLPADTPASFREECGSCHLAFPPALLAAADWQRTMAGLKDHFGSDASLSAQTEKEIADFLLRCAGSAGKLGAPAVRRGSARPSASRASTARCRPATGAIRASSRRAIAKPVIAMRRMVASASTTSRFPNCGDKP